MENANLYSDLQRSEAAIRESERSLSLIVDRIPGLVCTMTAAVYDITPARKCFYSGPLGSIWIDVCDDALMVARSSQFDLYLLANEER